jgi:hypothetical protein
MIDNNPAAGIAPEKIIDYIEDIRDLLSKPPIRQYSWYLILLIVKWRISND